jgi:hypothetical protein
MYTPAGSTTMDTAASGEGRVEDTGILIEGQRTNIVLQSQSFNTTWAKEPTIVAEVITDNAVAPDGTNTADKFQDATTANSPRALRQSVTHSASTSYVSSVYAKAGEKSWISLRSLTSAATPYAWFDLSSGTVGTVDAGITAGIRSVGNGWYRCWIVDVSDNPVAYNLLDINLASGDGNKIYVGVVGEGIYIWGAKIEVGPFPSSYIPTTTAAVTRNADVLTIQTSGNIDNVDGTLALQWTPIFDNNMTTGAAYYLFDAGGLEAYYNATDQKIYLTDGTNTVSSAALTFSANVVQKLAFRWGPSGLLVYRDGSEAATGATYTEPALNANLYIGTDTSSANSAYSNIKPVRTWNREFSASEMGTITQ